MLDSKNAVLVIVDVQGKLAQIMYDRDNLFRNLHILVCGLKLLNIPIIWMEQVPEKLGSTIPEIKDVLTDQKPITKDVFSCAKNDEFNNVIDKIDPKEIILAGIESHICVLQTAIDLLKNKVQVYIVEECVGSRKLNDSNLGVRRMLKNGASLINFEMIFFELIRDSNNKLFKKLSSRSEKLTCTSFYA